jgi:hypothetical protein
VLSLLNGGVRKMGKKGGREIGDKTKNEEKNQSKKKAEKKNRWTRQRIRRGRKMSGILDPDLFSKSQLHANKTRYLKTVM